MKRNLRKAILNTFALILIVGAATLAANAQAQYRRATDFDGDGKADITVVRRDNDVNAGIWYSYQSSNDSVAATYWGWAGDKRATGDFDGDGRADLAVIRRNGTQFGWHIRRSSDGGYTAFNFGLSTDSPLPADYDGDGKTDIAVVRENNNGAGQIVSLTWYYRGSLTGQTGSATATVAATGGGGAGYRCVPMNGDYEGDGKADFTQRCYNSSTGAAVIWDTLYSSSGTRDQFQWGLSGSDYAAPGDYDGDGRTDYAVVRRRSLGGFQFQYDWYVRLSSSGGTLAQSYGGQFGSTTDLPVPADYDGDGKTDFAVARQDSTSSSSVGVAYYIQQSSNNQTRAMYWGVSSDVATFYGAYNSGLANANP